MKKYIYQVVLPVFILGVGIGVYNLQNSTAGRVERMAGGRPSAPAEASKESQSSAQATDSNASNTEQKPASSRRTAQSASGRGGQFGATASATVDSLKLSAGEWSAQLTLFGKTFSYRQRQMLSAFTSEVTQIDVTAGQRVTAGQPLLMLDDEDLQRSLAQAENQLSSIDAQIRLYELQASTDVENLKIEEKLLNIQQASVARYESLNNLQLSSSNDYETALMSYQNQLKSVQTQRLAIASHKDELAQLNYQRVEQQLAIDSLRSQLDDATVVAPFAGVIATVAVSEGDQVTENTHLLTVYDDQQLGLETRIPLAQADGLNRSASPVEASVTLADGNHRLTLTDLDLLAEFGSVAAKFRFESPVPIALGEHKPLTVQLPAQAEVFAAPASSLYENKRVYKIENMTLVDADVSVTGQTLVDGRTWYIFNSAQLRSGDTILVTRLPNASRGLKVSLPDENKQGRL